MNDLTQTLAVGAVLVFETAHYSDKTWHGPVRVLKAFVKQEVVDAFLAARALTGPIPVQDESDWSDELEPHPNEFMVWLVRAGFVEDTAPVHTWHLGENYGKFRP